MADWEDWEAEADSGKTEIKKDPKFKDEEDEAIDIDAKPETVIKPQPQNPDKVAKKNKADQMAKRWEEKDKKFDDLVNDKRGPLTANELREAQKRSEESDLKNTVDLFGGFIQKTEETNMKTEKAFVDFAKKIAEILAKEDRKKYIQEFMKELLQQIYPKLTSLEYEDIHSKCTILFNQKQKEEKGPTQKKKTTQAKLNVSKANAAAKMMDFSDEEEEGGEAYVSGRFAGDDFM